MQRNQIVQGWAARCRSDERSIVVKGETSVSRSRNDVTTRPRIACGRCRAQRTEAEWSALPAVAQVEGDELATVVSRWPEDMVIVVRACSCGAPIARATRTHAP